MSDSNNNFNGFIQMHRELLECYANHMTPDLYKQVDAASQRDFCYSQRVRLEEQLIKGKINVNDFFAAAKSE